MLVYYNPMEELGSTLSWRNAKPFLRTVCDDGNAYVSNWIPAVDVYEDKVSLRLNIQLPGVAMKDVKILVMDHMMKVEGERKAVNDQKQEGYYIREAKFGNFSRCFSLPKYVNPEKAKATCDRGVLTIAIPKQEEAKPKLISIESQEVSSKGIS